MKLCTMISCFWFLESAILFKNLRIVHSGRMHLPDSPGKLVWSYSKLLILYFHIYVCLVCLFLCFYRCLIGHFWFLSWAHSVWLVWLIWIAAIFFSNPYLIIVLIIPCRFPHSERWEVCLHWLHFLLVYHLIKACLSDLL